MNLIREPKVPLTNFGLRDFLQSLTYKVQNNDLPCPGYSVATDPTGRVLVSATFYPLGGKTGLHSINIEITSIEDHPDEK